MMTTGEAVMAICEKLEDISVGMNNIACILEERDNELQTERNALFCAAKGVLRELDLGCDSWIRLQEVVDNIEEKM